MEADALSALVNLGYRRPEALPAVARVVARLGDDAALDAVIRDSLKELAPVSVERRHAPLSAGRAPRRTPPRPACGRRPWPSSSASRPAARTSAIFIQAARGRGEALDHVLLHGPPGLGKTTLAQIVARELGVGFRATSGPVIQRAGDLAAILTNLQPRDVLFIDEIHRLQPAIEEVLYPAMEDFQLDLIIGEGPAARSVRIDLAAVHPGRRDHARRAAGDAAARPLRHPAAAGVLHAGGTGADRRARRREARLRADRRTAPPRSPAARRGTPRIAGRLLRRVRDFAACRRAHDPVDRAIADAALTRLEVDRLGLDAMDRRYLRRIAEHHAGGPVGVETLAAALAEARDTLEDVVEPYLIQEGLVLRTSRGRMLGEPGWRHLGLMPPAGVRSRQLDLLARMSMTGACRIHRRCRPPSLCRPRLLRGHRCRRHRLSRQLSALCRAGAHRGPARRSACRMTNWSTQHGLIFVVRRVKWTICARRGWTIC